MNSSQSSKLINIFWTYFFVGAALAFFAFEWTRIWIGIGFVLVGVFYYLYLLSEEYNTSIVELDERLVERIEDIERQQFRLCEANSRIARLEKELMSLEDDILESQEYESLKDRTKQQRNRRGRIRVGIDS